jgi:hypothetical protein
VSTSGTPHRPTGVATRRMTRASTSGARASDPSTCCMVLLSPASRRCEASFSLTLDPRCGHGAAGAGALVSVRRPMLPRSRPPVSGGARAPHERAMRLEAWRFTPQRSTHPRCGRRDERDRRLLRERIIDDGAHRRAGTERFVQLDERASCIRARGTLFRSWRACQIFVTLLASRVPPNLLAKSRSATSCFTKPRLVGSIRWRTPWSARTVRPAVSPPAPTSTSSVPSEPQSRTSCTNVRSRCERAVPSKHPA